MKRSNPTAGRRLISREQWKDPVKMLKMYFYAIPPCWKRGDLAWVCGILWV